jgi:hypothetical protein
VETAPVRKVARFLASTLPIAAVAAACSRSPHLVQSDVEKQVKDTAVSLVPSAQVGTASCPPDQPFTPGTRFTCTVTTNGLAARWDVVLTNQKSLLISPVDTVLDITRVRDDVTRQLEAAGRPSTEVDCGADHYRLVPLGATVTCAVGGSAVGAVEARVTDVSGAVKVSSP